MRPWMVLFQWFLLFLYRAGNMIGRMVAALSLIKLIIYLQIIIRMIKLIIYLEIIIMTYGHGNNKIPPTLTHSRHKEVIRILRNQEKGQSNYHAG